MKATSKTKETAKETAKETTNKTTNGATKQTIVIEVKAETEAAATKLDVPVVNTVETPTEPDEDDDKPKLPPWRTAMKQKKEAEIKRRDEEQRKLVSHLLCCAIKFTNSFFHGG